MPDSERLVSDSKMYSKGAVQLITRSQFGLACVVTGALEPVGQAIVKELACHGVAYIFVCFSLSTSTSACDSLVKEVAASHPNTKLVPYPTDITSENDTLGLVDDVLNACGRLDVWICSSGLLGPASIEDTGLAELQECWETNALAPFYALKWTRKAMEKTCSKGSYPNAVPKDGAYGRIIVVGGTDHENEGWYSAVALSSTPLIISHALLR